MKTKYLFYSLALAGTFAACTQEELIESPVAENNVANRPVAGVVEFSTDDVESRFNHESATWQNGDVFGLYLMDEYIGNYTGDPDGADCPGEHKNANQYLTKKLDGVQDEVNGYSLWAYQDHWFGMYQFVDNIQSNYPFTYSTTDKTWTNDAKLVEGNYFAMYPQNEKALNRRELWHQIDPSVTLKKHSRFATDKKNVFLNLDNQFFLGYSQIYRNETSSAEGVLKMKLSMKGAMIPVEFVLQGFSNNDVKLDKIEFKTTSTNQLPTLAFIEPALADGEENWVKFRTKPGQWPEYYFYESNCGAHHGVNLYSEEKTWTRKTMQDLITWNTDQARIPYGCEEKKAYSYSFEFPGEFDEKVVLEGNKNQSVYAYFALPSLDEGGWSQVYAQVYGWQLMNEGTKYERWEYGILTNLDLNNQNQNTDITVTNKSFALSNAMQNSWMASENNYFLTVIANYDNYGWATVDEAQVSATSQMEELIKGRVQRASSGDEVEITVKPDANGVEVKQELIDWLIEEAKKYKDITIIFDGSRGGIVNFNENNTMGIDTEAAGEEYSVKFVYNGGIVLNNNANEQIIPGTFQANGDGTAVVMNNKNLKVLGKLHKVENYGDMVVAYQYVNGVESKGNVVEVKNFKNLTLERQTTVTTLTNEPRAKVDVTAPKNYAANVTTLHNNNGKVECTECNDATLNVIGQLNAGKIENYAVVTVTGRLNLTEGLFNHDSHIHAGKQGGVINNNGLIEGKVNNVGTIYNGDSTGKTGTFDGEVNNYKEINAYEGKFTNLQPKENSVLNVWNEKADVQITDQNRNYYIIFKGVVAQHVDNSAKGLKVFELAKDERLIDLMTMMYYTGSTVIKTSKNIIFEEYDKEAASDAIYAIVSPTMAAIEHVYVDGTDVKFYEDVPSTWDWNWANATLEVKAPQNGVEYKLSIENGTSIKVKNVVVSDKKYLHIATGSKLDTANGVIDHNGMQSADVTGTTQTPDIQNGEI